MRFSQLLRGAAASLAVGGLALAGITPAAAPAKAAGVSGTAAVPAISRSSLKSAKVPSLCGLKPGRLKNGKLPGSGARGGAWLGTSAIGQLVKGKKAGAVAAFSCHRGGVAWPNVVVFYHSGGGIAGTSNLTTVLQSGRGEVRKVTIKKRTAYVQVTGVVEPWESNAGATGSALLQYRWNAKKKRMVLVKKTRYNARFYTKKIVSAINAGKPAIARRYADADIVSMLAGAKRRLVADSCASDSNGTYMCRVNAYKGKDNLPAFLYLKPSGWNTWRVYDLS